MQLKRFGAEWIAGGACVVLALACYWIATLRTGLFSEVGVNGIFINLAASGIELAAGIIVINIVLARHEQKRMRKVFQFLEVPFRDLEIVLIQHLTRVRVSWLKARTVDEPLTQEESNQIAGAYVQHVAVYDRILAEIRTALVRLPNLVDRSTAPDLLTNVFMGQRAVDALASATASSDLRRKEMAEHLVATLQHTQRILDVLDD